MSENQFFNKADNRERLKGARITYIKPTFTCLADRLWYEFWQEHFRDTMCLFGAFGIIAIVYLIFFIF